MASNLPPGVDPATVPANAPPPGVTPNFVDPSNLETTTTAMCVLMITLVTAAVALRLYSTVHVTHSTSLEDYSCLIATVLLYGYIGMIIYLNKFAIHIWDIPLSWLDAVYFKGRFARDMFIGPVTFFAKASILLLYVRIFAPSKWFRNTVWIAMFFMFALYWSYVGVNAGLCAPRPGQSWLFPGVLERCQEQQSYAVVQGVGNVVIDLLILALPLPIILHLRMNRRKKVGILAVFGTGVIALVCSVISLVYRVKLDGSPDWSWNGAICYIAIIVEVGITIVCSCAPAIFSLGRHLAHDSSRFASLRSRLLRARESTRSSDVKTPYESSQEERRFEAGYLELEEQVPSRKGAERVPSLGEGRNTDFETDTQAIMMENRTRKGIVKTMDVDVDVESNGRSGGYSR